jgi:fibro-slime domain-containing protein
MRPSTAGAHVRGTPRRYDTCMRFTRVILFASLACAASVAPAVAGPGGSISATYYVLPENHPDVGHGIDGRTIPGLVAQHLGPHGFPIATTFARTKGGPASGPIHDVNSDGEIMWWSTASTHGVRLDGRGTVAMPLLITAMFPVGHPNDTHGFRTAHFRGTFDTSAQSSGAVKLGSDDDAWVFVDGVLKVDNGGVKALTFTPYSLGRLSSGKHVIDIFYADRYGSGAAIEIDAALPFAPAPQMATPSIASRHPSLTAGQMRAQLNKYGRFTLRDIHFAFNKTDITPDSAAVLGQVGTLLRDDSRLRLRVEGFTDDVGGAAYNLNLSQRRAEAVKNYLVIHTHIASTRLMAKGYGESRPVATNATAAGRALNRRVDFVRY